MEDRPYVFTADKWINSDEKIYVTRHVVQKHEKPHTHEFIEIEYVINGSGYQYVNGKEYYAEKGNILFLNFGDVHAQTSINKMEVVDCILSPGFVSSELSYSENAIDILTLSSFKVFSNSIENITPVIKLAGKELIEMETLIE